MPEEAKEKKAKTAKKVGRPQGTRNTPSEERRKELLELAKRSGYTPVVKWAKDAVDLQHRIAEEEKAEIRDTTYIIQLRRLLFDMEKELNSYFLPKLKPVDTQIDQKATKGDVKVVLADPFANLRGLRDSEVVDV